MELNAAFWKWFGDSKVVDANGDPLVVYHGRGGRKPKTFDRKCNIGSFFTADEDVARGYAGLQTAKGKMYGAAIKRGGSVGAYYLSIQNPVHWDRNESEKFSTWIFNEYMIGDRDIDDHRDDFECFLKHNKEAYDYYDEEEGLDEAINYLQNAFAKGNQYDIDWRELDPLASMIREYSVESGYDGIFRDYSGGGIEFITLKPTQIKSIDNRGTWDADDPVVSNPPMLATHRGSRWFHATPTDKAGMSILDSGLINVSDPKNKSYAAPRSGFTYMSKNLETAAIYALGGVFMDSEYPEEHWRGNGRYGWIFEVDTSGPIDAEPDEDEVGKLLYNCKPSHGKPRSPCLSWLNDMAQYYVAPRRLRGVRDGDVHLWASVGKQLISKMSPDEKIEVIALCENIAVSGNTKFIYAWRLDKTRAKEITKNGSNVLEIAERMI